MSDHKNTRHDSLRVMFVITSMPIGGAETLLVNLMRRFDGQRIEPQVCCLKHRDVLGEEISNEFPVHQNLIGGKFDLLVINRLRRLFRTERIDAIVTVGAGDKMFWGRLAAKAAGVPVVLSALHSTGWPDGVGKMNRLLTPITDGFIGVAESHGKFLVDFEKFPAGKVFVIPNGIDTDRFKLDNEARQSWRERLAVADHESLVGIVAALRPEKNHELFLKSAAEVLKKSPHTKFAIAGDGPERPKLEGLVQELSIQERVHFLGSVSDIPGFLSAVDLFSLTSHNEASPVSILEAMACERPVVAPDVGSIKESVLVGETGYLFPAGDLAAVSDLWLQVLGNRLEAQKLGSAAREHVCRTSSLDSMTLGYTELIESLYQDKTNTRLAFHSVAGFENPPEKLRDRERYVG